VERRSGVLVTASWWSSADAGSGSAAMRWVATECWWSSAADADAGSGLLTRRVATECCEGDERWSAAREMGSDGLLRGRWEVVAAEATPRPATWHCLISPHFLTAPAWRLHCCQSAHTCARWAYVSVAEPHGWWRYVSAQVRASRVPVECPSARKRDRGRCGALAYLRVSWRRR